MHRGGSQPDAGLSSAAAFSLSCQPATILLPGNDRVAMGAVHAYVIAEALRAALQHCVNVDVHHEAHAQHVVTQRRNHPIRSALEAAV
ncbi:MAG: hypothetical protein QOD99_1155 [Chthoniobacter sp.]|nr:hypothetical protein [Chthoniobacter sp.]